jgi:hypothetical protein
VAFGGAVFPGAPVAGFSDAAGAAARAAAGGFRVALGTAAAGDLLAAAGALLSVLEAAGGLAAPAAED